MTDSTLDRHVDIFNERKTCRQCDTTVGVVCDEHQLKTITLSYPEFCLIVEALSTTNARLSTLVNDLNSLRAYGLAADTEKHLQQLIALQARFGGEG